MMMMMMMIIIIIIVYNNNINNNGKHFKYTFSQRLNANAEMILRFVT